MQFKKRKIRYKKKSFWSSILPKQKKIKVNEKTKYRAGLLIGFLLIIVLFFYGCSVLIQQVGLINIIGIFGEPLNKDTFGNTNVLLIGTGGKGHDGADLTDTIILASIDEQNKIVPMLSIPRDFYVNVDEIGGGIRINRVYELGKQKYDSITGIELLKEAIEEITGTNIHYYVKINFDGFKDIVDSLDGVEVYVDEAIHDPFYPKGETIYFETFSLPSGLQKLDGETALKYVRSRKTTSDFDRSKRQQKLLFAIKNEAMNKNILLNPGKIKDLFDAVSKNIETNLSLRHIIELAKISQDINQENIVSRVISDDPTQCGGFLYVPERELFSGAYVLVPIGNHFDFIHQYVDLIFHYPEVNKSLVQVQILNGTKIVGLAAETKALLKRLCFDVIRFGNAQNQQISKTSLFYRDEESPPAALDFINHIIPGNLSPEIPEKYLEPQYISDANIIIELGKDYADTRPEDIFYLYYPAQSSSTSTTDEKSEETTEEGESATPKENNESATEATTENNEAIIEATTATIP